MKRIMAAILATCVMLTFGFLWLFNNSSGEDHSDSQPHLGIPSNVGTTKRKQPLDDGESFVSATTDDVSVALEAETLGDKSTSTDAESFTAMALDALAVTKEEFEHLPEEDQDKMMKAFVDQFWDDELNPSSEPGEPERHLSLEIFNRPYIQTLTEREFLKLSPQDQEAAMGEIMESARQRRTRAFDIIREARLLASNNDYVRAEAYLLHALETGRDLSGNKEGMIITRLVGIACEKKALNEMVELYKRIGDQSKVQIAQNRLREIEDEVEEIRNTAKESGPR